MDTLNQILYLLFPFSPGEFILQLMVNNDTVHAVEQIRQRFLKVHSSCVGGRECDDHLGSHTFIFTP